MRIKHLPSIRRQSSLAILTALLAFSSPVKAGDNVFTSAEFLEQTKNGQDTYIGISVGMTAFIASQTDNHKKKATCIDNWYHSDKPQKNDFIRKIMRENSGYHPQAIILGVLEKQCGEF
ncbi:MAG: hypothetical protein MK137_08280 [Rickettsiales bacterium]|nr:hypothetical protein [Rickettsiales bacterium]